MKLIILNMIYHCHNQIVTITVIALLHGLKYPQANIYIYIYICIMIRYSAKNLPRNLAKGNNTS
jgi:hypothetical protein